MSRVCASMRIQIASDLHLEALPPEPRVSRHPRSSRGRLRVLQSVSRQPPPDAFRPVADRDVLVLAGNIGTHLLPRDFVLRELELSPVIYVPGNCEYRCFRERKRVDADWLAFAGEHRDLHYLVSAGVTVGGVRFWGTPWHSNLWGNYAAWARSEPWRLRTCERHVGDFRYPHGGVGRWTLRRHVEAHAAETALLVQQIGAVDVVVTHWPPTKAAIHASCERDELNPYLVNDREQLVRTMWAKAWISGHVHEAYEYRVGPTLCIGNPAGYPGEDRVSGLFRPDRVVTVEVGR